MRWIEHFRLGPATCLLMTLALVTAVILMTLSAATSAFVRSRTSGLDPAPLIAAFREGKVDLELFLPDHYAHAIGEEQVMQGASTYTVFLYGWQYSEDHAAVVTCGREVVFAIGFSERGHTHFAVMRPYPPENSKDGEHETDASRM